MIKQLLFAFAAVAAFCASAAPPRIEELDEFGRAAALSLDDVAHFTNDFALDWWRPARKPGFPGIVCERAQEFHIVANALEQAQFGVAACKSDAAKVRALAVGAEKSGRDVIDGLVHQGLKIEDRAKLDQLLAYRKVALAGGMTGYSFTLVLVAQGIMFVNGAVVDDPARQVAYLVTADVTQLCGLSSPTGKRTVESAFCPDTGKALLAVVTSLAKRDVSR